MCTRCVDAVLRLLGVFHDVLYGDVAPVRPGSTLGVVSVRLSRSLFVPGRQLKKGGSPPFPPPPPPRSWLPHQGGHQEAGWFPLPSFPHQGGHCESGERRPHANVYFFFVFFVFFFVCFLFFFLCIFFFCIFFFFFGGGGRAVRGVWGWECAQVESSLFL